MSEKNRAELISVLLRADGETEDVRICVCIYMCVCVCGGRRQPMYI